jgi:hypothetical protein
MRKATPPSSPTSLDRKVAKESKNKEKEKKKRRKKSKFSPHFVAPTHYSARVSVSASKNLLKKSHWTLPQNKSVISTRIEIIFGAENHVVRQDLMLPSVDDESGDSGGFRSPRGNSWELTFNMTSHDIVSQATLDYNPDLAYNVPILMRVMAKVEGEKEDKTLCDLRRYVDISSPGDRRFELEMMPGLRILEPDDLASVRIIVDKSQAFETNRTYRSVKHLTPRT